MNKQITHIIFDVDGTLVNQSSVFQAQVSAVSEYFPGVSAQAVLDTFFYAHEQIMKTAPEHRSDSKVHLEKMAQQMAVSLSETQLESASVAWSRAYQKAVQNTVLYSDVQESLATLKRVGFKLYLASGNTKENRATLLEQHNLQGMFADIFAAQTVGFQKQDKRFWEQVLAQLQVRPEQVLVVGNQLNDDILHPSQLGMHTALIERGESLKYPVAKSVAVPDSVVSSLSGLSVLPQKSDKICFVLQSATPGTHMDYVYEVARVLKEEEKLPLTLLIEKKASIQYPNWVVTQAFSFASLRVLENFFRILSLRLQGCKKFYIHYSFLSVFSA